MDGSRKALTGVVCVEWYNETPAAAREARPPQEGIGGRVVFNSSASAPEVTLAVKGMGSGAFVTPAQFLIKPLKRELPVKSEIRRFPALRVWQSTGSSPERGSAFGSSAKCFPQTHLSMSPSPPASPGLLKCAWQEALQPPKSQLSKQPPARTGSQAVGRRGQRDGFPVPALPPLCLAGIVPRNWLTLWLGWQGKAFLVVWHIINDQNGFK